MRARLFGLVACAALVATACEINIDESVDGAVVDTDTVEVPVQISPAPDPNDPQQGEIIQEEFLVDVNGVQVRPDENGRAVATVPVDRSRVFTPIESELTLDFGPNVSETDRSTVISVDNSRTTWIDDNAYSRNSGAIFLQQSAIDKLVPTLQDTVDVDFASLFPIGECIVDTGLIRGCVADIRLAGYGIDDVSIGNGDASLTVRTGQITAYVDAWVNILFPIYCGIRVDIDYAVFTGSYDLRTRSTGNRGQIDVVQTGVSFSPGANRLNFTAGICSFPIISDLAQILAPSIGIGDVAELFGEIGGEALADPDGSGPRDAPVAEAIEGALEDIQIGKAVGQSLDANFDAPIRSIDEAGNHIALRADIQMTAKQIAPNSPNLDGSYAYITPGGAPYPGTRTPTGAGYDLALGISATGFNQLMKQQTENGLLTLDISEDANGEPLTLGSLYESGNLGQCPLFCDAPMELQIRPEFAPVLVPEPGPNGELAVLEIGGLNVETIIGGTPLIGVTFDARVGADIGLENGTFGVQMSEPAADSTNLTVTSNPSDLPIALVETLFGQLTPALFPLIADSVEAFSVPELGGIEADIHEVARIGDFLYLFGNVGSGNPTNPSNPIVDPDWTFDQSNTDNYLVQSEEDSELCLSVHEERVEPGAQVEATDAATIATSFFDSNRSATTTSCW